MSGPGDGKLTSGAAQPPAIARRTVVVSPDEVWPDPARAAPVELGPEPARHSFFAPIAMVTALSSALLTVFLVVVGLWIWLKG